MHLPVTSIKAVDIPDAWFQLISAIIDEGFSYKIQHGSFVGQTRLEFHMAVATINYAYKEPYDLMLPEIPVHLNFPPPVQKGYIEQYIPYLMDSPKKEGEQYTYGSRIYKQIDYFINLLKRTPNTNQAILQVARPSDGLKLIDPPCLRHIGMKVRNNRLIFYPYFRSWDLWGGFPANLAGIAVLQKFMADSIGVCVGPICAMSHALHIYGYVNELVKLRCNK